MRKLKSISVILVFFFVLTAFVKSTSNSENISENTTKEIISIVDNANKKETEEIKNDENRYLGHRGLYEFKNYEVIKDSNDKNLLVLNMNVTNTTEGQILPTFSFFLDSDFEQVLENGEKVKLDNSSILSKDKEKKIMPNETVNIQVPVEINENSGSIIIKDIYTKGESFNKTINL